MKKLISLCLVLAMLLPALAACDEKVLSAPQNVVLSETGLLTWDAVENAEGYIVTIGDKTYTAED